MKFEFFNVYLFIFEIVLNKRIKIVVVKNNASDIVRRLFPTALPSIHRYIEVTRRLPIIPPRRPKINPLRNSVLSNVCFAFLIFTQIQLLAPLFLLQEFQSS